MSDIVILGIQGLHPAFLSSYGNSLQISPVLDRLAQESIVFDWCFSAQIDPDLMWRELFCGDSTLGSEKPDLVNLAASTGLSTAWFSDGEAPNPLASFIHQSSLDEWGLGGFQMLLDEAAQWLTSQQSDVFLTVCSSVATPPWEAPDDFLEPYLSELESEDDPGEFITQIDLVGEYLAVLNTIDALIGEFVETMTSRGRPFRLVIAGLGHDEFPEGQREFGSLKEHQAHVPLIVASVDEHCDKIKTREFANNDLAGRHSGLVQLIDIHRWMRHHWFTDQDGAPLPSREYAYAEIGDGIHILRTPFWTFGMDENSGECSLFVKPEDRWCRNDVSAQEIVLSEKFEDFLRMYLKARQAQFPEGEPPLPDSLSQV